MVTDNHYRWDFIGLSTDTKPMPENSEKVVDGSTFYCSDTSKLYVFCQDNWYERKPLGGGGGGTSYTAGNGIDITNDTISVDTTVVQEKLTAGNNISIDNNVISATGGGSITPVQTTGTSTTDVMSQKVSSEIIYGEGAPSKKIALVNSSPNERISPSSGKYNSIGKYSVLLSADWTNAAGNENVLIGGSSGGQLGPSSPNTNLQGCVAIGFNATNDYNGSVSLGSFTRTSSVGEVNIGSSNANFGYNSTNYRLITGVHDPVNAHDAATKGYVDANAGGIKMLTDDDFNFPANNPSVLAPWLLPPGQYIVAPHTGVMPDGNSQTYDSSTPYGILVFTQAMSSGGGYGTFIISGNELNGYYKVEYNGTPVTGFPHEI